MKYIISGFGIILLLFIYSICSVSGKCSKIEELEEIKAKIAERE